MPIPDDIPSLKQVYEVLIAVHGRDDEESKELPEATYTFSDDALKVFASEHDRYVEWRHQINDDEQRRGVIAKVTGKLTRLCEILFALEQAFAVVEEQYDLDVDTWEFEIDESPCQKAVMIMQYPIHQKFNLMPPEVSLNVEERGAGEDDESSQLETFVEEEGYRIKKALEYVGNKRVSYQEATLYKEGCSPPPPPPRKRMGKLKVKPNMPCLSSRACARQDLGTCLKN